MGGLQPARMEGKRSTVRGAETVGDRQQLPAPCYLILNSKTKVFFLMLNGKNKPHLLIGLI